MNIQKDRVVTLDYTLTDSEGEIIDSSEGADPLVYLHGNENIIPGLEKHLDGKTSGDAVKCVVPAAEGYGERDNDLIFKVGKAEFGADADVQVGMQFEAHGEEGAQIVTVMAINGDEITIDANHPLAGEELHFDVKVVDVREATAEELEHGHVHPAGGCGCGCEGECGDDCKCGDDCECGDDCGCEDDECEDKATSCGCGCGDK